jgi:hypothetical protein
VGRSITRCGSSLAQQKSQIASLEALINSQVRRRARPGADARQCQRSPCVPRLATPDWRRTGATRARRGGVACTSVAWQEVDEFMKMNHAQVDRTPQLNRPGPGRVGA